MKQLIAALALAVAGTTAAAELDEVLEKNIEARGGYQNWQQVQTARLSGRMMMGEGMEAPFRIEFKRPDKVRMEFDVQGMTGIQAYDGRTGWFVMPLMGKTEPEEMAEDQLKEVREMADFDGPLVDYQQKGHNVELLGTEEVEGAKAYKIQLTKADGDVSTIWLDADFLEFKQTSRTERQGNEVVVHTTLGDYKEVGDVVMAHSMEMQFEGMPVTQSISIENAELNVEIDDSRFAMPESAAAAE